MHGEIEGVVILTDVESYIGYLKWKGAHYKQPSLEREIRVVNDSVQNNKNYQGDMKMLYGWFVEIFDDVTQNPYCKEIKKSSDKYFYVIKAMREAPSKFDSTEKNDDVQEYILQIIGEVKEHATTDELDGLEINGEIEKYMKK